MNTMTALKQLVGKKVKAGYSTTGYSESDLDRMCRASGYARCQVREPGFMYDAQYDDSRVLVHVDDSGTIQSVQVG